MKNLYYFEINNYDENIKCVSVKIQHHTRLETIKTFRMTE